MQNIITMKVHGRPWQSEILLNYLLIVLTLLNAFFSRQPKCQWYRRIVRSAEEGDKNTFVFLAFGTAQPFIHCQVGITFISSLSGASLETALVMLLLDGWEHTSLAIAAGSFLSLAFDHIDRIWGTLSEILNRYNP